MREINDVDTTGAIWGEFEEKFEDFLNEQPEDYWCWLYGNNYAYRDL